MKNARRAGLSGLFLGAFVFGVLLVVPYSFAKANDGPNVLRYVPAVSNPLFNESPIITTEVRPIYFHHDIPNDFLTGGGNVDVGALQFRIALTDRLAFIATKDGYADIKFAGALPNDDGFANIAAGLKYALIDNAADGNMVTIGLRYEVPSGSLDTGGINLQGGGDGFINVFVTALKQIDRFQVQASANANIALDGAHDSSLFVFALHANYMLTPHIFPLLEFNVYSVIDEGSRLPVDFEGFDLVNFGATDSGTVATVAAGARVKVTDNFQLGTAFEIPVTSREDITNWRLYVDAVVTF